jgi:uncharacterized protein (DUF1697 family)
MLRGINVTGHHTVRMVDLRVLCESLGFADVETYIQSGNIVSRSGQKSSPAIAAAIVNAIKRKFGFSINVIIREPGELRRIIKRNPFVGLRGVDETRLHVTFLEEDPSRALVKALGPLTAKTKDEFKVIDKEVYLYCPNGYGKTLLSDTFVEKNLKVAATTRNWYTVKTLSSMAGMNS